MSAILNNITEHHVEELLSHPSLNLDVFIAKCSNKLTIPNETNDRIYEHHSFPQAHVPLIFGSICVCNAFRFLLARPTKALRDKQ